MKIIFSTIMMIVLASAVWGEGLSRPEDDRITTLEIDGKTYTGISKVYVSGGKAIIVFTGGGTSVALDKLPDDFADSWLGEGKLAEAKSALADQAAQKTESAIRAGCFREVGGIVYDTRQAQSRWVSFRNVKIYQIVEDGALIDATPGNPYDIVPIFVKNLPKVVGDTDYVSFTALQVGTYDYINKLDNRRTVRAYDCGRVCERSEIPKSVLEGKTAFAETDGGKPPSRDVVTTLPESEDLQVCGSGFFISKDGYFITNAHVVKNARRVKLKIGGDVFPVKVVSEDTQRDLALLKAEGQFKALGIANEEAELGQAVFTIGFPDIKLQGTEPKYTDGKISSSSGIQDDPNQFQISVPVQPGNSGGPLVDFSGEVRGVIVARLNEIAALRSTGTLPQNVNYAIKGSVLRQFLSKFPYVQLDDRPKSADPAIKRAKEAVALVLAY